MIEDRGKDRGKSAVQAAGLVGGQAMKADDDGGVDAALHSKKVRRF